MTNYMVDSSILIRFARNLPAEVAWMTGVLNTGEVVGTCAVVVAECYTGAHAAERPGWQEVLDALTWWPIERDDAVTAGSLRYDAARAGRQLSLTDALIGVVAQRVGATVVTRNVKDFQLTGAQILVPA